LLLAIKRSDAPELVSEIAPISRRRDFQPLFLLSKQP